MPNAQTATLLPISNQRIVPDSMVYPDTLPSYNALDVSRFHHMRLNHATTFVEHRNHMNGIENFWHQANRHVGRFNGLRKETFPLYRKECEWRFNGGTHTQLFIQ